MNRRRSFVFCCVLSLATLAGPGAVHAAGFDLNALMDLLAHVKAGEATFIERREVSALDRTVESSGRLSFEAPDTFVRETLKPRHERLAVQGNQLTMEQGSRRRSLELDAAPEAAVLIDAIRGTLTGNRSALERRFNTLVAGSAARWTLTLTPREAQLRGLVVAVTVRGEEAAVREVDVQLADGDRSVMTITPRAAAARQSTSAASAALKPRANDSATSSQAP